MRHELQVIAISGCCILLAGFWLSGITANWIAAGQWLLQAGLLWAFICRYTWRRLDLNRASAEAHLYSSLGWGNRLTILRGGLIALTGGFLFLDQGDVLLPAALYNLASLLDRLDGFVARRSRTVSLLGSELDITFDALGLAVAPLLAVSMGKIHWSYLLLSMAYYIYRWGLQRRIRRGLTVHDLPPNPLRRTLAGFQMGFIALALWPLLNPIFTTIASIAFMLPVLFGFVVDWLIVTGRLQPQAPSTLESSSKRYFQPGLRVLLVPALFITGQDSSLFLSSDTTDPALLFALLFSTGLILLGLAGRLGALILIMLLGRHSAAGAIDVNGCVIIFTTCWILLLGTGRFSLWQWDDEWVQRYDGA